MYEYIINPKTKKKYKISTRKGQIILKNHLQQLINTKYGGDSQTLNYILGIGIPTSIIIGLLSGYFINKKYRSRRKKVNKDDNIKEDDNIKDYDVNWENINWHKDLDKCEYLFERVKVIKEDTENWANADPKVYKKHLETLFIHNLTELIKILKKKGISLNDIGIKGISIIDFKKLKLKEQIDYMISVCKDIQKYFEILNSK